MLAAVAWARQGAPALQPTTMELPEEPLDEEGDADGPDEVAKEAGQRADGKRSAPRKRGPAGDDDSDDDDDDDDVPFAFVRQNLAYFKNNKDDPYLTLKEEDEADSEVEDFTIRPTDLMLLGARSDEEMSNLEIYVYEPQEDNLYVHHDIPLPVFPLCLAWMETPPSTIKGPMGGGRNFVAVGSFQPFIEIWNLDVIDALEPAAVLGLAGAEAAAAAHEENAAEHEAAQPSTDKKSKKKKKKSRPVIMPPPAEGHTDAVMALAWNLLQPNVLASGSADKTVRLWDLNADLNSSAQVLRHHDDKVQALAWHPVDAAVILTAGFDRRATALDVRSPEAVRSWSLTADVEKVAWNPHDANYFAASTEDGVVRYFDARVNAKPVFTLQAHEGAASALGFNPEAAGVLATGGMDKKVKLWSLEGNKPAMIGSRDMGVGVVFDLGFSREHPALLAAGGSLGKLGVWNTLETEAMQARMPAAEAALDEEGRVMGGAVAGMGALDVDSSDEEGEEGEEAADDRATAREPEPGEQPAERAQLKARCKAGGKKGKPKGKKPPRGKKA